MRILTLLAILIAPSVHAAAGKGPVYGAGPSETSGQPITPSSVSASTVTVTGNGTGCFTADGLSVNCSNHAVLIAPGSTLNVGTATAYTGGGVFFSSGLATIQDNGLTAGSTVFQVLRSSGTPLCTFNEGNGVNATILKCMNNIGQNAITVSESGNVTISNVLASNNSFAMSAAAGTAQIAGTVAIGTGTGGGTTAFTNFGAEFFSSGTMVGISTTNNGSHYFELYGRNKVSQFFINDAGGVQTSSAVFVGVIVATQAAGTAGASVTALCASTNITGLFALSGGCDCASAIAITEVKSVPNCVTSGCIANGWTCQEPGGTGGQCSAYAVCSRLQ